MDKKITAIIAVTAALIIIISGTIYFLSKGPSMKSCKEINEELYNYVLAIKNQDISYCGNTGNPEFCKAHVMKDTTFCETHDDKDYCLAIITQNEDFCPENDLWCKADASKNIEYCEKMSEAEKQDCKADIELNEAYYKQKELC